MKKQLRTLEEDIDRKVRYRTDQFAEKERILNEKLIEYKKELQATNVEIDSLKKILHMKDLRCLELEKQVYLQENQVVNLTRQNDKYCHESQNKLAQM